MIATYRAVLDENEEIRKAQMAELDERRQLAVSAGKDVSAGGTHDQASRGLGPTEYAKAVAELESYLASRVPEALESRVDVLPALRHVWECFHELESTRPITSLPVGLGASIPLKGALPWHRVGAWLDERGIRQEPDRGTARRLLRAMDNVYLAHQSESLNKESSEEEQDG